MVVLDLSSPRWADLVHAYGPATAIPHQLAQLQAAPPDAAWLFQEWASEPLATLGNALVHQGTVYPASYAALPHVVAIAAHQAVPNRIICLNLIGCIAMGQQVPGAPRMPPDLEAAYHDALVQAADVLIDCLRFDWPDADYRVLFSALAAVRGHGVLAEAILTS